MLAGMNTKTIGKTTLKDSQRSQPNKKTPTKILAREKQNKIAKYSNKKNRK